MMSFVVQTASFSDLAIAREERGKSRPQRRLICFDHSTPRLQLVCPSPSSLLTSFRVVFSSELLVVWSQEEAVS